MAWSCRSLAAFLPLTCITAPQVVLGRHAERPAGPILLDKDFKYGGQVGKFHVFRLDQTQ